MAILSAALATPQYYHHVAKFDRKSLSALPFTWGPSSASGRISATHASQCTRHTLLIVLHAIATWQLSFHTFHTELGLLTRSPRSLHHDSEVPKRSNTRQSVFSGLVTATVLLNVPARFARRPEHGSGTRTKSGSLQCAHVLSVHHPRARRNVQHGAWTGTLSAACCTHGTSASGRFGLNVK